MVDSQGWRSALWPEWTVDSPLGSGSFGHVYKIRRTDIGGTYYAALKVISVPGEEEARTMLAGVDREQRAACFQGLAKEISREFAVMERLKGHTNIVSYEDHKIVPKEDGLGWYVLIRMELLTPMLEHLSQTGCPESEVIRLGCDICDALILCQREKIIHRDIKPANIFISHYGSYKLGDFGIALNAGISWNERSARGTYPYMAPEVFQGKLYDASIDTYALGLILYRLLNHGRAPFLPLPPEPLTSGAVEAAHQRRLAGYRLPPPDRASPNMAAVIRKACAYDPRDRYRSALEMKQALEQCALEKTRVDYALGGEGFRRETEPPTLVARREPVSESRTEEKARMGRIFSAAGDL